MVRAWCASLAWALCFAATFRVGAGCRASGAGLGAGRSPPTTCFRHTHRARRVTLQARETQGHPRLAALV